MNSKKNTPQDPLGENAGIDPAAVDGAPPVCPQMVELAAGMSQDERSAVAYLESCGWKILLEARVDDARMKSGNRNRTFAARGRYPMILAMGAPKR